MSRGKPLPYILFYKEVRMKATIDNLLQMRANAKKNDIKTITVAGLDFTVNKLPITAVLNIMDDYGDTAGEQFEMFKELVYMSIPLFRDERLRAECDCKIPHDVVTEVLGENLQIITELGKAITNMYNMNDEVEELKK